MATVRDVAGLRVATAASRGAGQRGSRLAPAFYMLRSMAAIQMYAIKLVIGRGRQTPKVVSVINHPAHSREEAVAKAKALLAGTNWPADETPDGFQIFDGSGTQVA